LWMSEENRQLNSDIIIERQQLTFEVIHNMKGEDVCQTIFHDRCYPMVVRDIPLIFEYPVQLQE